MEVNMLKDNWELQGMVLDARILSSKKQDSDWKCYVIRIAGLGKQFEVQTQDVRFYDAAKDSKTVIAKGNFDFYNNTPKLMLREIIDAETGEVLAK